MTTLSQWLTTFLQHYSVPTNATRRPEISGFSEFSRLRPNSGVNTDTAQLSQGIDSTIHNRLSSIFELLNDSNSTSGVTRSASTPSTSVIQSTQVSIGNTEQGTASPSSSSAQLAATSPVSTLESTSSTTTTNSTEAPSTAPVSAGSFDISSALGQLTQTKNQYQSVLNAVDRIHGKTNKNDPWATATNWVTILNAFNPNLKAYLNGGTGTATFQGAVKDMNFVGSLDFAKEMGINIDRIKEALPHLTDSKGKPVRERLVKALNENVKGIQANLIMLSVAAELHHAADGVRSQLASCGGSSAELESELAEYECCIKKCMDCVNEEEVQSPLVIDMDADGRIDTTSQKVAFDINGNGDQESISQLAGADKFLVVDTNGNGQIDDATELFGNHTFGHSFANGYEALATLDSNGDGKITEADTIDGRSALDALAVGNIGEAKLTSLRQAGISELTVSYTNQDESLSGGDHIYQRSGAVLNGSKVDTADVWFSV